MIAAVSARHATGDCQPEAGTLGARREEGFEDPADQRFVHAATGVRDAKAYLFTVATDPKIHRALGRRRLDRILEQVGQCTGERFAITAEQRFGTLAMVGEVDLA